MHKAVGFYWTLPVPWAGFDHLSDDVEQASRQSRTIRYQMELVRRWARDVKYDLVQEGVFLELEPDRAGKLGRQGAAPEEVIPPPLTRLTAYCREHDATLLYVDFSQEIGWRSHMVMDGWGRKHGIRCEQVPVMDAGLAFDGKPFDPEEHFRQWRAKQKAWMASKPQRQARALARASEFRRQGMTLAAIAQALNAEGNLSPTGRKWTAENIRKMLGKASLSDRATG